MRRPVTALVQARMSSRRLPGKVLQSLGPQTTLEMTIGRLRQATELDEIVLATSTEPSDDGIEAFAKECGCELRRGPLDDVLGRFVGALQGSPAEGVLRVTADCPLIDPTVVDRLIALWRSSGADYVSNVVEPMSFPKGLNAEVISRSALEDAAAEADDPADREHVTTYIRARPERFSTIGLWLDPPLPDAVVTLDTPEDLTRIRALIAELGPDPELAELLSALGGGAGHTYRDGPG